VLTALLAVPVGCGSPEPYETQDGDATRLDGTRVDVGAMTVAKALESRRGEPVYVRGYVLAQPDSPHRLCTRLTKGGACQGPFLVIDLAKVDLRDERGQALEHGCCAIGAWTPRPVVLEVRLERGRRALVLG
jgi:hypothetical protein